MPTSQPEAAAAVDTAQLRVLAQNAHLRGVFSDLIEMHEGTAASDPADFEQGLNVGSVRTPSGFNVHVHVLIVSPADQFPEPDDERFSRRVHAHVYAAYDLPSGLEISDDTLDVFAATSGRLHCLPYLREFVANTTARSEKGAITLPITGVANVQVDAKT